jgi:hypothetical protein
VVTRRDAIGAVNANMLTAAVAPAVTWRRRPGGYARRMLLSDRDIRAEIAAGRLGIDPFDDTLIQPSSVDSCDDR